MTDGLQPQAGRSARGEKEDAWNYAYKLLSAGWPLAGIRGGAPSVWVKKRFGLLYATSAKFNSLCRYEKAKKKD